MVVVFITLTGKPFGSLRRKFGNKRLSLTDSIVFILSGCGIRFSFGIVKVIVVVGGGLNCV